MHPTLSTFVDGFQHSFLPPSPYRGAKGTDWRISRVWRDYMKQWLLDRYRARFELPVGRRRLDAALWIDQQSFETGNIDIALEWEWDHNQVAKAFCDGDFEKLFAVGACCGLAIVHTRIDGRRGKAQVDSVIQNMKRCLHEYRRGDESVAAIEIRRILDRRDEVRFEVITHDLDENVQRGLMAWSYASS